MQQTPEEYWHQATTHAGKQLALVAKALQKKYTATDGHGKLVADIEATRDIYPDLSTFETWARKNRDVLIAVLQEDTEKFVF